MLALPGHTSGLDTLASSGSCHRTKAAAFRRELELLLLPVGSLPTSVTCPLRSTALPRFLAITGQSAPARRIGTFGLAGSLLGPFPLASPDRFSSSVREPE